MPTPLTVTIAPDSFKGTLSADDAAQAIAAGWRVERPGDTLLLTPMADGGEGSLDAIARATEGARRVPVSVQGPDDRPVAAEWLFLPDSAGGGIGVVELANTSGITLLNPLRPLDAHTRGFGQAIVAALDGGVTRLVLAIGGSSSTDGGTGLLVALGARFLDASGGPVAPGGGGLAALDRADLSGLRPPPVGGVSVLSDVTHPLLGASGAAVVFGPQKGADPHAVRELDHNLARLAAALGGDPTEPGTGAAGGAGYGLRAWGAVLTPGAAAVGEIVGLPRRIAASDVVITGEGRFDQQSLGGKVPSYVRACAAHGSARTCLMAGTVEWVGAAKGNAGTGFDEVYSLSELAGSVESAMRDPAGWLSYAGRHLARQYRV